MASIAQRLFNYVPVNYLLLQGEEWLRPLPQLGAWNRIRIGILCAVRPVGSGSNLQDGGLMFGLCSGRWNTNSSMVTDNAVGVCVNNSPALNTQRNWSYNANSGQPFYSVTVNGNYYRRYTNPISGQVVNIIGLSNSPWLPPAGVGIRRRRSPMVLDISRNPTTGVYTFQIYFANDQTIDWRADQLLEAVDTYGTPIVGGPWTSATAQTINCSESTGMLDTVSVWWTNVIYGLEVYGICASVLTDAGTSVQLAYPQVGGGYDVFGTTGTLVGGVISGTGTAWTGLASGRGFFAPYTFIGTSSLTPVISLSGTDIGGDDSFDQYPSGTFYGTFNSGTNWGGAWIVAGTWGNPQAVQGNNGTLYGTLVGNDDTFDQYTSGTMISGSMNGGTNWGGAWVIAGTYSSSRAVVGGTGTFYGTLTGAYDSFDTYSAGSTTISLANGSNWGAPYVPLTYTGTTYSNPTLTADGTFMYGTASGWPWDNFEGYSTGAITLLTGGTGWGSFGTIYDF